MTSFTVQDFLETAKWNCTATNDIMTLSPAVVVALFPRETRQRGEEGEGETVTRQTISIPTIPTVFAQRLQP